MNYYGENRHNLLAAPLIIVLAVALALLLHFATVPAYKAITVYLPEAAEGSQPFCISNRSHNYVTIAKGPTLQTGQFITVSEVRDFAWGFTDPAPTTDRTDVDCYVIGD